MTGWEARACALADEVAASPRVGRLHADRTEPGQIVTGCKMNRFAMLGNGMDVLEIETGRGYGAALLAKRLGERHVVSVDAPGRSPIGENDQSHCASPSPLRPSSAASASRRFLRCARDPAPRG